MHNRTNICDIVILWHYIMAGHVNIDDYRIMPDRKRLIVKWTPQNVTIFGMILHAV